MPKKAKRRDEFDGARYEQMSTESGTNFVASDNSWTDNLYRPWDGETRESGRAKCGRVSVGIFALLVLLCGGAIIGVAAAVHSKSMLKLCADCHQAINGSYIFGACVSAVGLIGILAVVLRRRFIAVPFMILTLIIGAGMIAFGIVCIILKEDTSLIHLGGVWDSTVKDDPKFICWVQDTLECSGFEHCCISAPYVGPVNATAPSTHLLLGNATLPCFYINATNHTVNASGVEVDWPMRECVPEAMACNSSQKYRDTCQSAIENQVNKYLTPIVGISFPVGAVFFFFAILSVCVIKKRPS